MEHHIHFWRLSMDAKKLDYYFIVKYLKKLIMIKTARHQADAIHPLLATSAIASPALSQESPRRAIQPHPELRAQCIPGHYQQVR